MGAIKHHRLHICHSVFAFFWITVFDLGGKASKIRPQAIHTCKRALHTLMPFKFVSGFLYVLTCAKRQVKSDRNQKSTTYTLMPFKFMCDSLYVLTCAKRPVKSVKSGMSRVFVAWYSFAHQSIISSFSNLTEWFSSPSFSSQIPLKRDPRDRDWRGGYD